MEVAGSEINQKMRSAIKAKLTELGCYVDDELPDYVMVMVANKRTRSQMEDDLQLFLGGNTQLFVNWLHQVLKKLQEVSVSTAAPPVPPVNEDPKPAKSKSSSKDREKAKEDKKKDKKLSKERDKHHKKSLKTIGLTKKSKKEAKKKEKARKKITRTHKSKKKSCDEIIRPNVPPLLMNLEKESEPSITDIFAGQILKNHGINLEQNSRVETKVDDIKPLRKALKRNRFPIIDPATVSNITDTNSGATPTASLRETISVVDSIEPTSNDDTSIENVLVVAHKTNINISSGLDSLPIDDQIREINQIEAKIQGLKKKLADQLDSMSEDEDFLNIRTEAEELMNDFAEDVLQEITATQNTTSTPPLNALYKPHPTVTKVTSKPLPVQEEQDVLPVIELQLPKRPMRERLGVRPEREKRKSVERLTPEKEPPIEEKCKSSVRSRLGEAVDASRKRASRHTSPRDDSHEKKEETPSRRLLSKVSVLEVRRHGEERVARAGPASVVRVRPRPRLTLGAPAPSLLMRAVADAHKSLLSVPPKIDPEHSSVKKAMVLPMRRNVDAQKIVIQVQSDRIPSPEHSDCEIDFDTESMADLESDVDKNSNEYVPESAGKGSSHSVKYMPSHTSDSSILDDDTIKIHNPTVGSEKGPQFVVTLDGLDPNVFLAKKLKTEGMTGDDLVLKSKKSTREEPSKPASTETTKASETKISPKTVESNKCDTITKPKDNNNEPMDNGIKNECKLSTTTKKSKTPAKSTSKALEKVSPENNRKSENTAIKIENSPPAVKKRKASPIVFDVAVRASERAEKRDRRERKESAGSDITVTTTSSHKYDSLPSLPPEKRKLPCRMFPACRFGPTCAFSHPPCKFNAGCTRRDCVYSHPPAAAPAHTPPPAIASHVVPVSNYKCITPSALPGVCKFFPSCGNPACHFLHPKPCRYGKACINKLECNFYHHEANASTKWRSPFQV